MRSNHVAGLALVLLLSPACAFADLSEDVIQRLRAEGYERFEVTRTFLGRTRILATGQDGQREIVLNPRSGEILRDWEDEDDDDRSGRDHERGRDRDRDRDDEDDRDDDDDRDEDDNSGRGGGSDDDDDDDDD